ncbi:MAG: hypothetical protein GY866_25505 [Proteobacteria bacterium]|nr:hypothetical protein [Pseudomonadota bacterium]
MEANAAVHDEENWSYEEARELVAFTQTLLEYVYIMPYRIKELRKSTAS